MQHLDFSDINKASALLLSLGEENIALLIAAMRDDEIKIVSSNMAHLGIIQVELLEQVCQEFLECIKCIGGVVGTYEGTHDLLLKALPKDRALHIMEEIGGPVGRTMWEKLGNVNEDSLASYLKNEYPQTIAVVLSMIKSSHAAKILTRLPETIAFEVLMRILKMESVQEIILSRVECILRVEFMSNLARASRQDPHKLVAEIFNNLDRLVEAKFMGELDQRDRDASDRIKGHMFTFDDLARISPSGLQLLVRKIDKNTLTLALKGSTDQLRGLIINQLSERAASMIRDDMLSMGSVRVRDVDEAQMRIIRQAKQMALAGEINISSGDDDRTID